MKPKSQIRNRSILKRPISFGEMLLGISTICLLVVVYLVVFRDALAPRIEETTIRRQVGYMSYAEDTQLRVTIPWKVLGWMLGSSVVVAMTSGLWMLVRSNRRGLAIKVVTIPSIMLPVVAGLTFLGTARSSGRKIDCLYRLKALQLVANEFSQSAEQNMNQAISVEELRNRYEGDPSIFLCPGDRKPTSRYGAESVTGTSYRILLVPDEDPDAMPVVNCNRHGIEINGHRGISVPSRK